jgi:hypothetical protein
MTWGGPNAVARFSPGPVPLVGSKRRQPNLKLKTQKLKVKSAEPEAIGMLRLDTFDF